jgi:O-antigen ligase
MTLGAIYFIKKDFHTNKYIKNNSNSLLFLIFFSVCILATIINGNGFNKFNNIYFIIHSAVFFYLIMQENHNNYDYLNILNFIIILITATLALISVLTILVYISNRTGLTSRINSETLQKSFNRYAPLNKRWYTLLQNANTFGHLVSMSFFLNIIPYKTLKNKKYKNSILIMTAINTVVLVLTGSRGAFASIFGGLIVFILYLIIKLSKNNKKKLFIVIISVISSLLIISLIDKFLLTSISFKESLISILRIKKLTNVSGRINTWANLLKLPFFTNIFGFNDDYLYHYLKDLNAFYPQGFLNNSGRAHNMYLEVLVSYGIIAFGLFISCIIKTFIQVIKSYCFIEKENKLFFLVFFVQFIAILVGGIVEQLPIFNLSTHSLIFMFVWANLITLTTTKKIEK